MSDEYSLESMMNALSKFLVGEDGVATELSNDIKANYNQAKGYVAGFFDNAQNARDRNKLVTLGVEHTPLYWMLETGVIGEGYDPTSKRSRALNARGLRGNATLNSMESILREMKSQGTTYLPHGNYVKALFPGSKGDETITVDDGLAQVEALKDLYAKDTYAGQKTDLGETASTLIRGMEAVSPLLVASAGFRPDLTRKLMGTHLLMDALSGRLNFRTPELAGQTGLVQLLNPYMAMATIGFSSEASKGF
jgi:hypothetical protein